MRRIRGSPVLNLTHAFIDSKTRKFDETKDGDDATCSICFCDFREDPNLPICELNCSNKHIFHVECLKKWVVKNNKCPLCLEVIPDKV